MLRTLVEGSLINNTGKNQFKTLLFTLEWIIPLKTLRDRRINSD